MTRVGYRLCGARSKYWRISRRPVGGLAALLAVLALGGPVAGCRGSARSEPKSLEIVVPTDVATLDPRFSTRALDVKISRLIHAGLVGLAPDTLEPVPLAARRWWWRDQQTLRVELRPGLRFHSGHPLGPADVCATLRAVADPRLGSPHRPVVQSIGACRPVSEQAVDVVLSRPRATLLTDLEIPILRADQAHAPPDPGAQLDGLGPYRVAEASASVVQLVPAETGLLPRPARPVVIRTIRDENARALRLLAGRADIAPNAISPALLPALEGRAELATRTRPGANVTYLLMHNERPPFHRAAVRRAVARAIDRELLVRTLLAGRAQVARSFLPPGHWAEPEGARPEPFDPASARVLLDPLPAVTLLTSTDRARVTIARAVAQMLNDAGLEVRVVQLDLGVLLERLDAGDYDAAILQIPELTEPNVLRWFFHPGGVPGEGGEGKNRARYRSARAAHLLDLASRDRDTDARRQLYAKLVAVMAEDMPAVPLWHEDQVAVVSASASGFVPSAEGRWLGVAALP